MRAKKAKKLRKLSDTGKKRLYFIKDGVIYADPVRQAYQYIKKYANQAKD